jgi:glyoxalase family protein
MDDKVLGLHHITAIAGKAQSNLDFYTKILGLRLVKKTVNFDDPGTFHFYFGDQKGTPGSILTFFPWEGIQQGYNGTGMATSIGYAIPEDSMGFWTERLKRFNVKQEEVIEKFGEPCLKFTDPDGLKLELLVPAEVDKREPWVTKEVNASVATRGFHQVTLTLKNVTPTAAILTGILGYALKKQEGNLYRFKTDSVENASIIDIVEAPNLDRGLGAAGTNHHVAFRVKNEIVLMNYREKIESKGLHITPKIDREYFFSLYFREPGGVLFELATDNPGFTVDEPLNELGTNLKLPKQYEAMRKEIEKVLPAIV